MSGKHKRLGDSPWWYTRSIENAGIALPLGSGLERMVGVSGFAPVAAPEKPPVEQQSYEPETQAEPEYQQPETSESGVPPSEPPKKKGGLHWWQKAVFAGGVAAVTLAGYFVGINALRHQQNDGISTPTPAATATYTPAPTRTPQPTPTATPIPGLENVMNETQLKATLEEVLAIDRNLTPADTEILKKMEDINKTIYYMLSGKTFEQQNLGTKIVTSEEYDSKVPEGLKGTIGTVVRGNDGIEYIYAALPQQPKGLITTLASETGQGWILEEGPLNRDVGVTNPNPYLGIRGGGEMKQALYRGAVVNKIKELGVKDFLPSQDLIAAGKSHTPDSLVDRITNSDWFFYDAWTLAWAFALDNTETAANLERTGWAGSEALIRLFKYNAKLDHKQNTFETNVERHKEFENKMTAVLQNEASYAPQIKEAIQKRVSQEGKAFLNADTLP